MERHQKAGERDHCADHRVECAENKVHQVCKKIATFRDLERVFVNSLLPIIGLFKDGNLSN